MLHVTQYSWASYTAVHQAGSKWQKTSRHLWQVALYYMSCQLYKKVTSYFIVKKGGLFFQSNVSEDMQPN